MHIGKALLTLALLLLSSSATAATIFTFDVTGTNAFDTTPMSFSFNSGEFTFAKEIDGSSTHFVSAVASGEDFDEATFIAYDTSVAPGNELFRYSFAGNVLFLSYQASGGGQGDVTETVSLTADNITRSDGPVSVPAPASLLLFGTGLLGAGVSRWRQRRS